VIRYARKLTTPFLISRLKQNGKRVSSRNRTTPTHKPSLAIILCSHVQSRFQRSPLQCGGWSNRLRLFDGKWIQISRPTTHELDRVQVHQNGTANLGVLSTFFVASRKGRADNSQCRPSKVRTLIQAEKDQLAFCHSLANDSNESPHDP
jgi:hypothetical protein